MVRNAIQYMLIGVACCALLFGLVACQKQPTWQEQYDLGMRYLSESNYEEAILAFTAAIEIDPKQVDSYAYLIQTQLAIGNVEEAEQTRIRGFNATGDGRLGIPLGDGWIWYGESSVFEERLTYRPFVFLNENQQETIRKSIQFTKEKNGEEVRDLLFNSDLPNQLCTEVDGFKIDIRIIRTPEEYRKYRWDDRESGKDYREEIYLEFRPENGDGYVYEWTSGMDSTYVINDNDIQSTNEFIHPFYRETYHCAECVNWQFNGAWSGRFHSFSHHYSFTNDYNSSRSYEDDYREGTGTVTDNTVSVEHLYVKYSNDYYYVLEAEPLRENKPYYDEEIYVYEDGKLISCQHNGQDVSEEQFSMISESKMYDGAVNELETNIWLHW